MQTQPQPTEHSIINSSDEIRLYGVLSHAVDDIWQEALPLIEKALHYSDGKYTTDHILKFLKSRDMQLWVVFNNAGMKGIIVTQIVNYPTEKRLCIVLLAGISFKSWMHSCWYLIKEWAKNEGCVSCEIFGRPGWEKVIKKLGFEKIHTVLKTSL